MARNRPRRTRLRRAAVLVAVVAVARELAFRRNDRRHPLVDPGRPA